MSSMASDSDWKKWGKQDPYFGVITLPEFKADRIGANIDLLFETGRRDIAATLTQMERLYGTTVTSAALDFGSGVGRLVLPLSQRFDHVVGVDISEDMIREARQNCSGAGAHNVDFVRSDDNLSAVTGAFDLVHSYIVLQHIPVSRGLALTDRLLSRLNPGGVAVLHYSLQRTLPLAKALAYAMKHNSLIGRAMLNVVQRRAWNTPAMQMNNYPLTGILDVFERCGMTDIVVVPEQQVSALTARVFAQKRKN